MTTPHKYTKLEVELIEVLAVGYTEFWVTDNEESMDAYSLMERKLRELGFIRISGGLVDFDKLAEIKKGVE